MKLYNFEYHQLKNDMLYFVLKIVVRISTRIFYKRVQIEGTENIPQARKKAMIVVANHPNTFMDPLLVASILPQQMHFLTNGGVFKTKFHHWVLGLLNMIPIYRKQDKNGSKGDNQQSFQKCYEHLADQKSILIFPEGSSFIERKLRPIKTGTARIALGAEEINNFDIGVEILPIGLNYESPNFFRTNVHIKVGQPISLKEYQNTLKEEKEKSVKNVSLIIEERLKELIIHTKDEKEDDLIHKIETIYQHQKDEKNWLELGQEVQQKINTLSNNELTSLENKAEEYFSLLSQHKISDKNVKASKTIISWTLLGLIISFPIYLFGLLNNYLAYKIPSLVTYSITKDEAFFAPITLIIGIFSFSILYPLQVYGFHQFSNDWFYTGLYALSLPIIGLFTLTYWKTIEFLKQEIQWKSLNKKSANIYQKRQAIIQILEVKQ
ncbi:MAG: hypothetical protein GY827_05800 [Cytophagales bacterium]|nr:hypothetical protein [Cytophagales bacterium]